MASRIYLINISGLDQVGILAAISGVLAKASAVILDVGESVIHSTLSLGLLVRLSGDVDVDRLARRLALILEPIGLSMNWDEVSDQEYRDWVWQGGKDTYTITVLTAALQATQFEAISNVCARQGLNIDRMRRLSGRLLPEAVGEGMHCIELSVRGEVKNEGSVREDWLRLGQEMGMDISVQRNNIFRRHRRLVAFDMDSTLIQIEVIDALAARTAHAAEIQKITEAAMRGELDFTESLKQRTAKLAGLPISVLEEVASDLPLMPGAKKLIGTFNRLGYKVAIISGGFDYFAQRLGSELGVDYVYANLLEIKNGVLTGEVAEPIIDRQRKKKLLREISQKEGLIMDQVIAIGDGANDLEMLASAGLGIAFHAKPIVAARSRHAISHGGLDLILYLLGISEQELKEVL
ncbi:MAG: phosphoserine phosphatase SerB [Gammaproteobacteria bacterium]